MRVDAHASSDDIDVAMLLAIVRRRLPKLLVLVRARGRGDVRRPVAHGAALRLGSAARDRLEGRGQSLRRSDAFGRKLQFGFRPHGQGGGQHARACAVVARSRGEDRRRDEARRRGSEFNSALGSEDRLSALLRMIGIGGPRARRERPGSRAQRLLQAARGLLAQGKPLHRHPLLLERSGARSGGRQQDRRDLPRAAGQSERGRDGRSAEGARAQDRSSCRRRSPGRGRGRGVPRRRPTSSRAASSRPGSTSNSSRR